MNSGHSWVRHFASTRRSGDCKNEILSRSPVGFASFNGSFISNRCMSREYFREDAVISETARSWCIRFSEMCLEVTWFSVKHDIASEAVKKFSRILLRSYTERIEPATCQNYFARIVNSARRDSFSRSDVCCYTIGTRVSSTDHLCIIAIKVQIRFPLFRDTCSRDEVIKFDWQMDNRITGSRSKLINELQCYKIIHHAKLLFVEHCM